MQFWIILFEITKRHYCLLANLDFIDEEQGFTCNNRNTDCRTYCLTGSVNINVFCKELLY